MGEMVSFREQRRHLRRLPRACPSRAAAPASSSSRSGGGSSTHITDVADRFAAEGFVALAPDFFHGAADRRARRGACGC